MYKADCPLCVALPAFSVAIETTYLLTVLYSFKFIFGTYTVTRWFLDCTLLREGLLECTVLRDGLLDCTLLQDCWTVPCYQVDCWNVHF